MWAMGQSINFRNRKHANQKEKRGNCFLNRTWMNAISTRDVVAHRKPCMDQ